MTKKRRRTESRHLPVRVTARENWGIALEVDGVVQSVSVPVEDEDRDDSSVAGPIPENSEPHPGPDGGYWGLLVPPECPRRALMLGLGGGTVAHLLAHRCGMTEITGIEHDPQVLDVARSQFGLETLPQLTIVEADAFAWVAEQCRTAERGGRGYDLVCLDLFQAGRLTQGVLATPFLRQVAELIEPEGILTMNLMVTARTPDQLHRLERVFVLTWQKRLHGNLVVHGRLPRSTDQDTALDNQNT